MNFEKAVETILSPAGVSINGNHPWDIQVKDRGFFPKVFLRGSLGLGESYMAGEWECEMLDDLVCRICRTDITARVKRTGEVNAWIKSCLLNMQGCKRAFNIGRVHYDIGNELYEKMLDKRMIYSCAVWEGAADLDQAQEIKLDLVCRKLDLAPGMKLLDIGCGWGGLARFAAERYKVAVTGITVSRQQAELAWENCRNLPVEIRFQDYRALTGRFDRVVSIGMFEHVGAKNYRTYLKKVREMLADDGLFLLHTIGNNRSVRHTDPWLDRYIFPDSVIPSICQISKAAEELWVMEDWHNIGPDYDKTLQAWWQNCEKHWAELPPGYDEKFKRMWRYYLLTCAGSFRARKNQVWQIVFSPEGRPGGYNRPPLPRGQGIPS
ncbi:MAG TPA: cyclopropane fatty acyl phospholipid synthase [Desulfurivibrionaceae bacterium]|nr:cyclopropane fatty acyl phospholipid synthase [Desulfurivibrionaceae bacterium]